MTFGDALAHMRQGKVAWRKSWPVEMELRAPADRLVLKDGGRTIVPEWHPSTADLFADDWDSGVEATR